MIYGRLLKHLSIGAILSLLLPLCASAQAGSAKYMGTGTCSSSNCHGSVHPRKSSDVLQNEYYTWIKHDKHSKAYSVLRGADGRRMASLLNIKDATKETLCLKCHATYVPDPAQRGEKFDIEDGVSCESCHGPAEGWLASHPETGATHQDNLARGLADTVSLDKRAKLCLSCHYGDDDQWVSHDLYGAGHPRLSFELDTYGVLQPKHWVIDEDYLKRKGPYVPLAAWLIGQETNAEAVVDTLLNPEISKKGMFPELSLFDCFSCHHSLTDEQWKKRAYDGQPGRLRLNLASLIMLQQALGALDQGLADELGQLVSTLHTSFQSSGALDTVEQIKSLLTSRVRPLVLKASASEATCKEMMRRLAQFGADTPFSKYEVAEQIGMGIQAAMATSPSLSRRYKAQLDQLFTGLKNAKSFKPEKFTAAAAGLAKALT